MDNAHMCNILYLTSQHKQGAQHFVHVCIYTMRAHTHTIHHSLCFIDFCQYSGDGPILHSTTAPSITHTLVEPPCRSLFPLHSGQQHCITAAPALQRAPTACGHACQNPVAGRPSLLPCGSAQGHTSVGDVHTPHHMHTSTTQHAHTHKHHTHHTTHTSTTHRTHTLYAHLKYLDLQLYKHPIHFNVVMHPSQARHPGFLLCAAAVSCKRRKIELRPT